MRRLPVVVAVVALGLGGGVPARAAGPARAFSVSAAAFPVEPAPGLNQTSLGVRPAATRADLSNPPATAYGRAAAYDLGTIELYTGPPPPESVAECDSGSPNIPDQAAAAPAGMQLAVTCDEAPRVEASAKGTSSGSDAFAVSGMTSRAAADGSADVITSEAAVTVQGIGLGPLIIDNVTTRAGARAGGVPGTADASGRVTASGASVNGTPVVIGADGVEVDRQKVPLEFVGPATAAVRDALAQGGYADIRVVQPETTTSADGAHAAVRGGGLMVFFNRNDPAQNYFIRMTFGGVALAVDVGQPVTVESAPTGASPPTPVGGTVAPGATGAGGGGSPSVGAVSAGPTVAPSARPVLTSGRRTYDLPEPWQGWPVLVAIGGAAAVVGWLTRRRLVGWWDVNADRYLRG